MSKHKRSFDRSLIDATLLDNLPEMRRLLEQGADPNARDREHQETALMVARSNSAARLLLDHGAEVNSSDERGWTALMVTNWPVLYERGADLDRSR
jgi:ankyrin repeat protein